MIVNFSSALVTGATGFVGKELVQTLSKFGVQVTCLNRSISQFNEDKNIVCHAVKKFDYATLHKILKNKTFDIVFHLAASGVNPKNSNGVDLFTGNLELTTQLLTALQNTKINKFIYAGSCSQYAPIEKPHCITEQHPLVPLTLYGAAKAATEIFARELTHTFTQAPFIALRFFNMYGPTEAEYRLLPYIINHLKKKTPVDLTPGEQVRDFLYINDVIAALILAANLLNRTSAFNVCSNKPISIADVAIETATQMKVTMNLLKFGSRPYRAHEPMWLVGDNSAFCAATNWQPTVSMPQGIAEMISVLRN